MSLKQNIFEKVTKLDIMKNTEEESLQRSEITNQKKEELETKTVKLKTETFINEEHNLAKIYMLTEKDSAFVHLKEKLA